MISIDKLIQQLQQCKDNSVTLPKMNDSLFTQKTAFEIRKNELELLDTNFKDLNEANYTIECSIVNDNLLSKKQGKFLKLLELRIECFRRSKK